ncbi:phosphatase PAP2 family protein [Ancylobacter pratisalsi]|uniref:Phosphatase PAP2 family protein n=1 Tax=Ancylobacter pratisalsi TaxID=1745854 RepID=A0A6P1YN08_9HYPH|nr:phosphatase PAP2 family protein [Ancylobacter pratisalsi]QIB33164.1 phosphatase PAP2 family protein [Ancylobacter pratisalsi]
MILLGFVIPAMLWFDRPVMVLVRTLPAWLTDSVAVCLLTLAIVAGVLIFARAIREKVIRHIPLGSGAVLVLVSALASLVAAGVLKHLIGRARPEASVDPWSFAPLAFDDSFASLPSAQASCAAAIAFSLAISLPRLKSALVLLSVAVALTRVLVGAHWLSDAIAGWALGAATVAGTSHAMQHWARKADAAR